MEIFLRFFLFPTDFVDQLGRMERTAAGKKADKVDQVEILDEQREFSRSHLVPAPPRILLARSSPHSYRRARTDAGRNRAAGGDSSTGTSNRQCGTTLQPTRWRDAQLLRILVSLLSLLGLRFRCSACKGGDFELPFVARRNLPPCLFCCLGHR